MKGKTIRSALPSFGYTLFVVILLARNVSLAGTSDNIVDIRNLGHRNWQTESFSIDKSLDVYIEVRGAETQEEDFMYAHAWILNARSRDVIWEMNMDKTSRRRRHKEVLYEGTVTLPEGDYEVYFAVSTFTIDIHIEGLGDLFESILHSFQDKRSSEDWGITIKVRAKNDMKYVHEYDPHQRDKSVIVQLTRIGDDKFQKEGFTLKKATNVRIYAVGEGSIRNREMSDYGWIVDTRTRGRIWEMNTRNTDHAGGADKNLIANEQITLQAGSYMVYYVTDGSHSYERWNARPPYDPTYWGITLWATDRDFTRHDVIPYVESEERRPIVELTRMQDDQFKSQGFTLSRPTDLHIYALGEYTSGMFHDYGLILDAYTRKRVWGMTRYNTHHAGGGKKNRLHDGIVHLSVGDYIVYYITDDSHSYQGWNAGPPYDPEAWGITIWVAEEDFEPNDIQCYLECEDPNILIDLTQLGNGEQRTERFYLDDKTKIRIYAIGEGDRDDMYDYGWIEDETGQVVWEMTYRNTEHAGGARKNRLFDEHIVLERGEYEVHFITDGSHSFESWNSTPPHDPFHWGVMVMRTE